MPLSTNDIHRIVANLERQGARTRKNGKGGWMVFPPNGSRALTIHCSPSAPNSENAMKRDIIRAGLVWPFSPEGKKF